MRVLLIAPHYYGDDAGEGWSTYKWVEGISRRHDATILTMHRRDWNPDASPVASKEVVNWVEAWSPQVLQRFRREAKPWYIRFHWCARRWIRTAVRSGRHFDLVHQINPLAMRYACPARGFGIPFIMGPVGGSLKTPPAFDDGSSDRTWYRRLRSLDEWRMRNGRGLRDTYSKASLVLGVTPATEDFVSIAGCRRFEVMGETGVDSVQSRIRPETDSTQPLRLLFVGRIIRTKGVIDAIRAVGIAARRCRVTFDILGDGEMIDECRREVESLGLGEIVTLHGNRPREEVNAWYDRSDVFLFPSFREPSGNVVFEAMGRGLPVITSSLGGPGYVVTDDCGFRFVPSTPALYAEKIAGGIMELYDDRSLLSKKSRAALQRMESLAVWERKIERLDALYHEVAESDE
ncbi:MAG: glycosyltransferase family 4 protein [Phycisphaera sp.]|nr:glycosyltransferase family 4 protein [Phycisphaera sp.]